MFNSFFFQFSYKQPLRDNLPDLIHTDWVPLGDKRKVNDFFPNLLNFNVE